MIEEDTEGQILVSIHVHTYKHLHITYKHTHRDRGSDRYNKHFGRDGTGRPTHTSSGWPGVLCVVESDPEFLIFISLPVEC